MSRVLVSAVRCPVPSDRAVMCCFPSYRQAQAAVLEALPRLHKLQVPTRRPDDYFAEMAKSDQQMQKVCAENNGFLSHAVCWV